MTQAKVQTPAMVVLFEGEDARNEAIGYIDAMVSCGYWPKGTVATMTVGTDVLEFVA